ncbi:MAG TPA: nucleotidyltransferase family protein [Minicystis sp.]|nr:nucleotidyltransferase family protein [Minicystis sp.]
MWGIVPSAGIGSRIQPLAFSKELLPVGGRDGGDAERPKAVSEYLVDRLVLGGAQKIAFVISPGKSDIVEYYGGEAFGASICYVVQPKPLGLCDAIFHARPLVADDEAVLVGLPDTVWFPEDGLALLPERGLSFLLFPVSHPERFDAVVTADDGSVLEIQVKQERATSNWIWGAFKLDGSLLRELHALWLEREKVDPYVGTLVNAWLARGHRAAAVRAGTSYVDVGTLEGYREAIRLLAQKDATRAATPEDKERRIA